MSRIEACRQSRHLFWLMVPLLFGCAESRQTHEDLDGTLWVQTSAEYRAICQQAYLTAQRQLANALEDPYWSADPIQSQQLANRQPGIEPLPPAVILDVDETVLDNSPYQARLIEQVASFDVESWHEWVMEAQADLIPGVEEFLNVARAKNVTVFFVTNRENAVEHGTRSNLESKGLVATNDVDRILSKREREAWTSDKESRRRYVAERYRVLLLIGDDLNDFVSVGNKPSPESRRELQEMHAEQWGVRWFMLPNPSYGGWERALYQWEDESPDAVKLQRKQKQLNTAVQTTEKDSSE